LASTVLTASSSSESDAAMMQFAAQKDPSEIESVFKEIAIDLMF
jgi:hypothetical protein